ncbi:hypothetical protein GMDG_08310 [Pseudogymnoascus destructans 20631-21]|uniref:Uncharacterized protein n=1 Tax=Pseudogymnoascus destructans (strain ATCC MYA-4855 / 20631-21) TaxID=658429 RepID=L8G3F3_PSED2|nr:hypothetical protein GMDG_08310 [Pseudogymnoascus destructans 20631-21]
MAIPSDSLATDGYEHDTLPTDEPHTHVSSQERASPDASVPGTPNSTDTNEGLVANPSHVQEGGLEHDGHLHETVMDETAVAAETGVGVIQPRPTQTSTSPRRSTLKSRPRLVKMFHRLQAPTRIPKVQEELLAKANQSMDDSMNDELQLQDPNRQLGLKKWWDGLGAHKNSEKWEKCLQGVFAGLFMASMLMRGTHSIGGRKRGTCPHPSEMYVDMCSPETIIPDGELPSKQAFAARAQAKRHFQNELQKKKLWGKMEKRYGIAVFLLLNPTLQEDHVRRLRESNLDLLLDRINERHPSLKQDLQGLSDHLSYYIDKGRLPTRKLRFEELSRSELESECLKSLSLSDMFKTLEPPAANAAANAPCEGPSMSEGSHVEGYYAVTEKVSVYAPPPPDQSRPAFSSSSSLRDVDEPLTPRLDVDSRVDSLPGIFDTAADTPGSSPAGYNTFEGEFEHYHNQVMASRDPNYDFSVPDNSTVC